MERNMQTRKRIQARREELGLNLGVHCAERRALPCSTISSGYEKGKIEKIKLPVIEAIAKALPSGPCLAARSNRLPDSRCAGACHRQLASPLCPRPTRIPLIGDIACGTPMPC